MNRQVFWLSFAVLAFAVLGAAWFFEHYDRVPSSRWEKPDKEAFRNRYLALERFSTAMGRPLARIWTLQDLERLAPGGVLLLDRARRFYLNPGRAERLLRWVRDGGYLLVAAEGESVDDPILKPFGVRRCEPDAPRDDEPEAAPAAGTTDGQAAACPNPNPDLEPATVLVRVPGTDRPLRFRQLPWPEECGLHPTHPAPAWQVGADRQRNALLHYAYGRGQVTVLENFDFLSNWRIGDYDHAELLWTLLRQYQPQGELRLAADLEVPSLWRWLVDSAWMVLVSGGFLIAAWLWAIVPRFGGLLPVTEPARRSLAEHLRALGRAVEREGGLAHWSDLVRQDLRETLIRRHPHLAKWSPREQADYLAGSTGIPAARLIDLFEPTGEVSKETYLERVRTAQQLQKTF